MKKLETKKAGTPTVKKPRPSLPNGISRARRGKSFRYHKANGGPVRDKSEIERIKKLRIPPAWRNVWISSSSGSRLQATGMDARGRKQYLYHQKHRDRQEREKYRRILRFAKALPKIRGQVKRDLDRRTLDSRKVLAAIVRLTELTLIRVGNDEYAKANNSYGLTTMTRKHVTVAGAQIEFHFLGKSKKHHTIKVRNAKLAKIVKACMALRGKDLFQYYDESGKLHDVKSNHVNKYLKEIGEENFTAKDFRTWSGTVLAAMALTEFEKFDSKASAKRYVREAIESVSRKLGNTPAICKSSYIHPAIITSYLDGEFVSRLKKQVDEKLKSRLRHFSAEEGVVLAFLQKQLNRRPSSRKSAK